MFEIVIFSINTISKTWMLNELIQANELVFMNFWYIEHYGACFGDGIDAKMNYSNHTEWLLCVY